MSGHSFSKYLKLTVIRMLSIYLISIYFQNILITVNFRYFENECPDIRKLNKKSLKRNCLKLLCCITKATFFICSLTCKKNICNFGS